MSLTVEVHEYPDRVVWRDRDHLYEEFKNMVQAQHKLPWEQFRSARFHHISFFGVVTQEGKWVDSALAFDAAVKFACMAEGLRPESYADMLVDMNGLNHSIVHSSLLKKMYEAGLLS